MAPTKSAAAPRTLKQFVKDQKRASCGVCKLPEPAREQLRGMADARIKAETAVAWLAAEYDAKVSVEDLNRHKNERHDQP